MLRKRWISSLAASLALLAAGCGNPEVIAPGALEVVYLPLDGAIDVALDAGLKIFFSGPVDPQSLGGNFFLRRSSLTELPTDSAANRFCGAHWSDVTATPSVSGEDSAVVFVSPDPATLQADTFYLLGCSAAVGGTDLGPLGDLGIPGCPSLGAVAIFRTTAE